MLRTLTRSGSPFGRYLQRQLRGHYTSAPTVGASGWPMPPPFPEVWQKGKEVVPHCKAAIQRFINIVVCYFSWLYLREPSFPPRSMSTGTKLTAQQADIVDRLMAWADPWSRSPQLRAASLGRTAGRMKSLGEVLQTLEVATRRIRDEMHCYGAGAEPHRPDQEFSGYRDRDPETVTIGSVKSDPTLIAQNVVPTRLKFPGEPSFDPRPLFDEVTRGAYEDPKVLRLQQPSSVPPRVRIRASREEQLQLFELWASGGRLALVAASFALWRCGLFTVYKSEDIDRMILDARPPNCFEKPLNKWTRTMATVISVLSIFLPPGHVLALYADDIRDYYYQFKISRARSVRNALVGDWRASDLQKIAAAGGLRVPQRGYVAACLNTMAMGDLNAVEFGQAAHFTMLARAGALGIGEELTLDAPHPRGRYMAGAIIDDHGPSLD